MGFYDFMYAFIVCALSVFVVYLCSSCICSGLILSD